MIVEEELYLEHYGKKGMKWGVRNEARADINKVGKAAREIIREGHRATTKQGRSAAATRYRKEVFDKIKSKEFKNAYQKANTMGKGEMATHILLLGPFAAITIPQTRAGYAERRSEGYEQEVDAAHEILREMRRA